MEDEQKYLELLKKIMNEGVVSNNRTGIRTKTLFAHQLRFNISESFPLFTTKFVPFGTIAKELFWFLSGSTDNKILKESGVNIWNTNCDRVFLDYYGFKNREVDDIGPSYGFQWRYYGANYIDCKTDYTGQGVDQIHKLVENIKKDPNSRRHILNSWNPSDISNTNLPPCHNLTQFQVINDKLNCSLYQRSGDMALGVPFNIASYSLLTYIIADICDLKPNEFVHTIGDCHVYETHFNGVLRQIERIPNKHPILKIKESHNWPEEYNLKDFEVIGYNPQETIKFKMAV